MDEHQQLEEVLRALADPVRRRAVAVLATGARRAGELAAATGVSPAVMSRHVRTLLATGLVDDERSVADARVRLFFLRREPLEELRSWLGAVVAGEPWPAGK
jgi:DNA-binding transcriptional ArsR family regulator